MNMERTRVPGVYSRGTRFVCVYRDDAGVQRKKAFRTQGEAAAYKKAQEVSVHQGTYQKPVQATLHAYAGTWLPRHELRKMSRDGYRRALKLHILEHFGPRVKLTDISRASIKRFYGHLKDNGAGLETVKKCRTVLSAMLSSAVEDELLRSNPCHGVKLPKYEQAPREDDHEDTDIRVFTDEQLRIVLSYVPSRHKLLFELLACTGLRISEAIALEWRHLQLDGSSPHVKVRRGYVRGDLGSGKSYAAKRDVPLPQGLVFKLRLLKNAGETFNNGAGSEALLKLVFPSETGTYLNDGNLRRRVLRPAMEEAGITEGGFHVFRHSFASKHIALGTNVVSLSKVMGHSKPSITMDLYGHLMEGYEAPALEITTTNGKVLVPR